jgi:hypothetical protein
MTILPLAQQLKIFSGLTFKGQMTIVIAEVISGC